MSHPAENQPPEYHQLDTYSSAAIYAVLARRRLGHQSPYDHFLCNYIGDPRPNSPKFRPYTRKGVSGTEYPYDNPANRITSYSKEGTMLDARHVRGTLKAEDLLAEWAVTTMDLDTGKLTEWHTSGIHKHGPYGREIVTLELSDGTPKPLAPVVADIDKDPLELVAAQRRAARGQACARLVLDQERGNVFTSWGGHAEPLSDAATLVREVNRLTKLFAIDLDAVAQAAHERGLTTTTPAQISA